MRLKRAGILALAGTFVLAGCGESTSSNNGSGSGNDSEPFYNSNDVIEIVVPFGEGGGTDVIARLYQEYLPEFIEGNPKVQVVNVPGSGGLNGANQYGMREADGYSLMQSSTSVLMQHLLGNEALEFDYSTQTPLMAIPGPGVTVISDDVYGGEPKELLELEEGELVYGSTSPNGAPAKTLMMLEFLKLADKTEFVWGYDGSSAAWLAFEQGEINMHSTPASLYLRSIEEQGITEPFSQIGEVTEDGEMQRHEEISDIPTVVEVYEEMYDEEPSGPLYDVVKAISIVDDMSKTIYMPEEAPEEAVSAMEEAMDELAQDEDFQNEIKELEDTESIIIGEELDTLATSLNDTNEESLNHMRKILHDDYGVEGLEY